MRTPIVIATALTALMLPGRADAAFDACTYDDGTKAVMATLSASTDGRLFVDTGGVISSGTPGGPATACGIATTTNTDAISVTGDSSIDVITIDLSGAGGAFAPGATDEADTTDEIEIDVNLGPEGPFDLTYAERLRVIGSGGDDRLGLSCDTNCAFSATAKRRINLNAAGGDIDQDLLLQNDGTDDKRLIELVLGTGNDVADATPSSGTPVPSRLIMSGGPGDDTLQGGDTADDFLPGPGTDAVDGGDSDSDDFQEGDRVDYSDSPAGLAGTAVGSTMSVQDGFGFTDTLTEVAVVVGSAHSDVLAFPDSVPGRGGRLIGGLGVDDLTGSEEEDLIQGGDGNDTIRGRGGFSTNLTCGPIMDVLQGGDGDDTIIGGDDPDSMSGDAGNDTLEGGPGAGTYTNCSFTQSVEGDTLAGGEGNDILRGGLDLDTYVLGTTGPLAQTDTLNEQPGQGVDLISTFQFPSTGGGSTVDLSTSGTALGSRGLTAIAVEAPGLAANFENVTGGTGPDDVTGNANVNVIRTLAGADTIRIADSVGDTGDCGADTDSAIADSLDTLIACEGTDPGGGGNTDPPPDSDADGIPDATDECDNASDAAAPRNPRNGCPADPVANPPTDGDGDGVFDTVDQCPAVPGPAPSGCPPVVPPPDATAGAPTACFVVTPATRKRTKLVPGGGEVLLTVSQTADPAVPLKIATGARRGVKIGSVAFKVNKKAVASTGSSVLVPFANLKIGARNAISVVVTLTNAKRVTVNDFVGLVKCPVPAVSCQRLSGGAQLKCSSSMPLRARSVSVAVFGADGKKATGKAKVTSTKGAKKGTYTLTMKTPVTFLPGRFVYKHVATTTRKGEKLLAVRVLNLK